MYLVKTPFWLRWVYPGRIWHKSRGKKLIYLTFDDGPIPVVTPFVLKTLECFNAKATFFCIGDNVSKHPDVYKQVLDEGHRVGNHTFNHLKGWDTADDIYLDNVAKCAEVVDSNLFRPPYGKAKRSQISKLTTRTPHPAPHTPHPTPHNPQPNSHFSITMWDVLSGDFDTSLAPEKCLANVLKHTENGSIIVFHDSLKAFERLEYVLPRALGAWKAAGFEFGIL